MMIDYLLAGAIGALAGYGLGVWVRGKCMPHSEEAARREGECAGIARGIRYSMRMLEAEAFRKVERELLDDANEADALAGMYEHIRSENEDE